MQAQAQAGAALNMSAAAIKSCIDTALATWGSYDKDGDGKLTIAEAVALLNSPEVGKWRLIHRGEHRYRVAHEGGLPRRTTVATTRGCFTSQAILNLAALSSAPTAPKAVTALPLSATNHVGWSTATLVAACRWLLAATDSLAG